MKLAVFAALIAFVSVSTACAEQITVDATGLTASISDDGQYTVTQRSPAWQYTGSIDQPPADVRQQAGKDGIGSYQSLQFRWNGSGNLTGEIRLYDTKPIAQFVLTCESEQAKPPAAFPTLQPPKGLHLFSYAENTFAPARFSGEDGGTPWLMFDDGGHAAILSPASHYMVASLHSARATTEPLANEDGSPSAASAPVQKTDAPIECGWVKPLANLPAGFSQATILCLGQKIGQTWTTWGQALTDLNGKKRPSNDADAGLKSFGYWTDNGATYYYNYDLSLGYADTLLAVKKAFSDLSIPLSYLQLDSWWYIKTSLGPDGKLGKPYKNANLPRGTWNCYGGLTEYVAHPDLFPKGLAAYHEQVGLPFITHNRWVDLNSPYREKYKISGVGAVDPKWWNDIAAYLKSVGVLTYEQDWLDRIYMYSPQFQSTPTAGDAFMDNMARACAERGMTLQYCMGLPRHYLQGSKYDNLTTIRVSGDRFDRHHWEPALYVSSMAASLGEWPWVDTFNSAETPNLILATLTAGMVGVGDKIGEIERGNIMNAIRGDGVIVKPDTSILPLDQSYLADANRKDQPMIAAAYSVHGDFRTAYVFAFPRNERQMKGAFRPVDLGYTSDVWVYDTLAKTGQRVARDEAFAVTFRDSAAKTAWAYYVVSPVSASGIALIGDAGKYASAGRQRLPKIAETNDGIRVDVAFAAGDSAVDLLGFSKTTPRVTLDGQPAANVSFDEKTSQFHIRVEPSNPQKAETEVTIAAK